MKTNLFWLGISLLTSHETVGQTPGVIRVKGGAGAEKTIPIADRYRYDQFRAGKIVFLNGSLASARFNYNILLGEMQFINPQGDTLALADEPLVRLVDISDPPSRSDQFWYDPAKGYVEMIEDYGTVKLGVKEGLKMAKREKLGGYDQSSGSSSITTYQFYSSGSMAVSKLAEKGDLVLIKNKTYYIIDQNGRFSPITKGSVLKVFSKHREQVMAYLTSQSINYKQPEDLKKLLKYCSELL